MTKLVDCVEESEIINYNETNECIYDSYTYAAEIVANSSVCAEKRSVKGYNNMGEVTRWIAENPVVPA